MGGGSLPVNICSWRQYTDYLNESQMTLSPGFPSRLYPQDLFLLGLYSPGTHVPS